MLALRLPPQIEKRLATLARKTGRTKSYYAREAIMRHIEDIEDFYLARPPAGAPQVAQASEGRGREARACRQ
jgi:predicted DNA-binding protein